MAFNLSMTVDLCMAYMLMFVSMTLTQGQWISRGKQYLSYGILIAHDGRLMHDIIICLFVSMTLSLTLKMFVRLGLVLSDKV